MRSFSSFNPWNLDYYSNVQTTRPSLLHALEKQPFEYYVLCWYKIYAKSCIWSVQNISWDLYCLNLVSGMNNNAANETEWINDLSEIQNQLSKTEIEEIIFLYGSQLDGKFIHCSALFTSQHSS